MIPERRLLDTAPLYLRAGDQIPDGVDPERVIFVSRQFIDSPERNDELPAPTQEAALASRASSERYVREPEDTHRITTGGGSGTCTKNSKGTSVTCTDGTNSATASCSGGCGTTSGSGDCIKK